MIYVGFTFKHYREGKLLKTYKRRNLVTHEGLENSLTGIFNDQTYQSSNWWFGLIGSGTITVNSTAASPGFTEYVNPGFTERKAATLNQFASNQDYTQVFSSGSIGIFEEATINGCFVINGGTGSPHAQPTLLAGFNFADPIDLIALDVVIISYTLEIAGLIVP